MIRVGVAGWDYPDWSGVVYPGASRELDRLAYISGWVDVVEVNSTFYRPVAPRVASSWVRRTRDRTGFSFTAKAHRSWTHAPTEAGADEIAATLNGLQPLRDAGRLGALLLQFPQSFHQRPETRARIDRLLERLDGWPVVIEVRHASWESEAAAEWLHRTCAGWCVVDQPRAGRSTAGSVVRVNGPRAYLRLHGRNEADWFRRDAGRDARYDYLYSTDELRELADTALALAGASEELFVIQNNHFRGQALVNALQMKRLLQGGRPAAPEDLVRHYPALESQVSVRRSRLF